MELELKTEQTVGTFQLKNYEELKNSVSELVTKYKSLVVTENDLDSAKSDRAKLNKVAKQFNDKRIALEKEYMKYFEVGKAQINNLVLMLKDASSSIDTQIKEYETKYQNEKLAQIRDVYSSKEQFIDFEKFVDKKWLNKGYTMKNVEDEIDIKVETIKKSLSIIDNLDKTSKCKELIKLSYLASLDLASAIDEGSKQYQYTQQIKEIESATNSEVESTESTQVISFKVYGTFTKLMQLSEFLKENGYKYETIKEEN